jgi:hypothetical protein
MDHEHLYDSAMHGFERFAAGSSFWYAVTHTPSPSIQDHVILATGNRRPEQAMLMV